MALKSSLLLAFLPVLLVFGGCGGGSSDTLSVDAPYAMLFKCTACEHEFEHEWKEIQAMKKDGNVIIPDGELMQVLCPSCGEIKGRDADPKVDQ